MSTTALIAISTPLDGLNFYSELFELKGPTGDSIFNTLRIGLSCERCKAMNKASECTHMKHLIPSWKSASKFDMVKAVYGDRKDLLARESMGQVTNDAASVFSQAQVESFFSRPVYPNMPKPDFIFLGVDPNGGGSSEFALTSIAMHMNNIILCGVESYCCKSHDEIKNVLLTHIKSLRLHPCFSQSWIIFFPENNLGQEASHMQAMLSEERKVWTYFEKQKAGVCTTHERKEMYTINCVQYFNQDAIHWAPNSICANPYVDVEKRMKRVKDEFRKQLLQFQKLTIANVNRPFEVAKVFFTGKVKPGMNDDIVMTLLFTVYWAQQFVNKKILCPYEKFVA